MTDLELHDGTEVIDGEIVDETCEDCGLLPGQIAADPLADLYDETVLVVLCDRCALERANDT